MLDVYYSAGGCETCDYGTEKTLTITCSNKKCGKLIYKKDYY